jgi:hypothetical protein
MLVGSTAFGISVQLLKLTMQSTESARDRIATTEAFARLAERFRADIHAARDISASEQSGKPARWIVKLSADERTEVEPREGQLLWTKYQGDKVDARDAFVLPERAVVRLELAPKEKPAIASLLLEIGDGADHSADHALRIDAAIGRDLRFATDPKDGK